MPVTCSVYGLGIHLNAELPGLAGLAPADRIDTCIEIGPLPSQVEAIAARAEEYYVSTELDDAGLPFFRVARARPGRELRIAFCDGTVAIINSAGSRVWITVPAGHTPEDTAACLLGTVLGVVLRLRGVTCLHASAVAVGDRAIVLVGPSGAGKSSTAAAFARLGHPILGDDLVALAETGDRFQVQPAYPRIRLWPETVTVLFGSAEALPRITPGWDKRFLDLNQPGYRFQREPMPLAAIYWLGERGAGLECQVEPVRPGEALMNLVAQTFATNFQDRSLRAMEFELLGRLIDRVPVRKLSLSTDLRQLSDGCQAILADFTSAGPSPGQP